MSSAAGSRMSEQEVRTFCHEVVDKVSKAGANKLQAAEEALKEAPNDAVRQTVVEISVSAPDDVTAAFVCAAVRSGGRELARAAADLLLDLKDAAVALPVVTECLRSTDVSVSRRGVEALERLADPAALGLLTQILESGEETVRRAAVNSFGLIVGSKYHPLKASLLEQLEDPDQGLARAILTSTDVGMRREVAQVLGFADSDLVVPVLDRLADDADVQTRREAVIALAARRGEAATAVLRKKLDDPDDVVALSVLDALGARLGRDTTEMFNVLVHALKHVHPSVRRQAVLMLDRYPVSRVEPVLLEVTRDPDFEVERAAEELLRRRQCQSGITALAQETDHDQDERTLVIWEAGNIGIESESAEARSSFKRTTGTTEDVLPILERAALEGSASNRVHAVGELIELADIADSPALQRALYDEDDAIRSRAAGGLAYTRDAGLMAELVSKHPDALVRRAAIEALAQDPGGQKSAGGPFARAIRFTSTRTIGMELFGHILSALGDYDEGVRQLACSGIGGYLDFGCPVPLAAAWRGLRAVEEDENASSMLRDSAHEMAERLAKSSLAEPAVRMVDRVLEWRGMVARTAHALRRSPGGGGCVPDARSGIAPDEIRKSWAYDFGLTAAQAESVANALTAGQPMPEEVAQALMQGIVRALAACSNAVYHASTAINLVGERRWSKNLAQWAQAMAGGPGLEWGDTEQVRAWRSLLARLRKRAGIAAQAAAEPPKDRAQSDTLNKALADEDDWVKMAALLVKASMSGSADDVLAGLASLCRSHADEIDYAEVVGAASVALVTASRADFIPVLEATLGQGSTEMRFDLTQALMAAAEDEKVAHAIHAHLSGRPVTTLGRMCMALALQGVGLTTTGLDVPDSVPAEADAELRCALWGLKAMRDDARAVDELEGRLRGGQGRERLCAAVYLGLARVRSAVPIFAGASDQIEAPFALRSFSAAMLVRRGHRLGPMWFAKAVSQTSGFDTARVVADFGRAVGSVIPMMLKCRNVNLGRFV